MSFTSVIRGPKAAKSVDPFPRVRLEMYQLSVAARKGYLWVTNRLGRDHWGGHLMNANRRAGKIHGYAFPP